MTPVEVINAIEGVANPTDVVTSTKRYYSIELVIAFGGEGALAHAGGRDEWTAALRAGDSRGVQNVDVGLVDLSQDEIGRFNVNGIEIYQHCPSGWSMPVVRAMGSIVK